MIDPYRELGITRDADDASVKKAYRQLSKKYHPDNNPGNKQAEDKFKTIQAAYEQIMNERKNGYTYDDHNTSGSYSDPFGFGGFGGFGGFAGNSGFNGYNSASQKTQAEKDLDSAAVYINNGCYNEALNVLNSMPETDRNDKWYYYSAVTNYQLGNEVTALSHAKIALSMSPDNYEYQRFVDSLENGNAWYMGRANSYKINPINGSSVCIKVLLANLICNLCFGGGGMFCGSNMGNFGGYPF